MPDGSIHEFEDAETSREVGDSGWFGLVEQMVHQARSDARHVHTKAGSGGGCWTNCDIRESAEQFLHDIRTGNAGLWSEWLDLASLSLNGSRPDRRTLTDDPKQPTTLPVVHHVKPAPVLAKRVGKGFATGFKHRDIERHGRLCGLLSTEQAQAYMHLTKAFRDRVKSGDIPVADRYATAQFFAKADLDAAKQTKWYAAAQKQRAPQFKSPQVTAQAIVESGFALDAAGIAEFLRLQTEETRATSPCYATAAL
jgi:hypothetical protein